MIDRFFGVCVGLALLSAAVPANAQTTGTTTKAAPKKPDAKKPDAKEKDKPAPPAAAETQPQTAEDQAQAKKREETVAEGDHPKDEEEAKRAVFMSADLAFTRTDLGGINDDLGFDKTAANGFLYGLAAGLRLKDLRLGARWRVFDTTEYDLWSVGGTIGYGLPLRPVSPVLTANVGYVWDQKINPSAIRSSLPAGTVLPPDVDVQGLLVGLDLNASYWVTKFLRLGAFIGTDFFFLSRERAPLPGSIFPLPPDIQNRALYSETGGSIGYTINLGLRGAFDIGF